jgi:choline dehydrogenase
VGENLCDHTEALVMWEARRPLPPEGATDWDACVLLRVDPASDAHDIHMHLPLMTFAVHSERLGFPTPAQAITMTPNVARPRSRGRLWLRSPDPDEPPAIDYRWFTDREGHDERMLVAGVRAARALAASPGLAEWIGNEVFPGPEATDDARISELARAGMNTVYHVSGTCRMGADADPAAVVDSQLRLRGEPGVRVVDASVFPCVTSVNPMVTVMMLAERASDLISTGLTV